MDTFHLFACTESAGGFLYECTADHCGRRIVVDRAGEMTVIDRGDQLVAHRGSSSGDIELSWPVVAQP